MNTKQRNEIRLKFVEQNLDTIKTLLQQNNNATWFHGTRGNHPIRRWIDSIRLAAGYGLKTDWRNIWFTLRRDYYKIIKNSTNEHERVSGTADRRNSTQ